MKTYKIAKESVRVEFRLYTWLKCHWTD